MSFASDLPVRKETDDVPKPMSPIAAASVLVLRYQPSHHCHEVFMVRRSARSVFMPDAWVFPGGRVEASDGDPDDPVRFSRAAARECEEEAALSVEPSSLLWFDSWITPSGEGPRRFYARFFQALLPFEQTLRAQSDGIETEHGAWRLPSEILAAAAASQVIVAPPTYCILQDLMRQGPLLDSPAALAREPSLAILPKEVATADGSLVVLPHDPQYHTFAGESLPCPARAHAHPRRFRRNERGWLPDAS